MLLQTRVKIPSYDGIHAGELRESLSYELANAAAKYVEVQQLAPSEIDPYTNEYEAKLVVFSKTEFTKKVRAIVTAYRAIGANSHEVDTLKKLLYS